MTVNKTPKTVGEIAEIIGQQVRPTSAGYAVSVYRESIASPWRVIVVGKSSVVAEVQVNNDSILRGLRGLYDLV